MSAIGVSDGDATGASSACGRGGGGAAPCASSGGRRVSILSRIGGTDAGNIGDGDPLPWKAVVTDSAFAGGGRLEAVRPSKNGSSSVIEPMGRGAETPRCSQSLRRT